MYLFVHAQLVFEHSEVVHDKRLPRTPLPIDPD